MMDRYRCTLCCHEFNPEKGVPLRDIRPVTAFEDLPAVRVCPVCMAATQDFSRV